MGSGQLAESFSVGEKVTTCSKGVALSLLEAIRVAKVGYVMRCSTFYSALSKVWLQLPKVGYLSVEKAVRKVHYLSHSSTPNDAVGG